MNSVSVPSEALKRTIILGLGLVLAPLFTYYGFMRGGGWPLMAVAVAPFFIMMISRLSAWFIIVVGLFYSWIYIPGLPRALSLFYVMAASMLPVLVASRAMRPPVYRSGRLTRAMAYGYTAVILVTMYVRGFGIKAFGGESWGGASYIQLLITLGFFLLSESVIISQKQWRLALALYFAASLLPSIAEITFLLSKGQSYWMYYFIRPDGISALGNLNVMLGGRGVLRFQISKYIAMIFVMCLALFPFRGKYRFWIAVSCLIAFGFAGLSGHRTMVLYLLLLMPLLMFFTTRRVPVRLLLTYGMGLAFLILALHMFGSHLPIAFQRAFSWVPFADISVTARESAVGTTRWRFEVWKQVLTYLPDSWLVGRGLIFDSYEYYSAARSSQATIEWAVITHNYHNGPLSLLIDLGIFGFIFGSGILFSTLSRHLRLLKTPWANETLTRYHRVLLASFCVDVFRFYAVHGDAASSFIDFLVQISLLECLYRTNQQALQEAAEAEPAAVTAPAVS
jgi:hypothetical protein